jgi:hypothetical protein
MVLENRVLRSMFGPKRGQAARGWRGLHNEKLHNLYASPNFIMVIKTRRMRWARHITYLRQMKTAYEILVGKTERKRTLLRK